jgi:hypothetical protein
MSNSFHKNIQLIETLYWLVNEQLFRENKRRDYGDGAESEW